MRRKGETKIFDRMGKSAELADANLVTYIDKAELFQQSDYDKEEYILCRGEVAFIDPPIYRDS
jgi:hypothetical protein